MPPVAAVTVVGLTKSAPAINLTDQSLPTTRLEPLLNRMLLPAWIVKRPPFTSVLSPRTQRVLRVIFWEACSRICEKEESELTSRVRFDGYPGSSLLIVPDEALLPVPDWSVILTGSIITVPPSQPVAAPPSTFDRIEFIWIAEISTCPPFPPWLPPAT